MIDETRVGVIHILLNDSHLHKDNDDINLGLKRCVWKTRISMMIYVVSESKRSEI